VVKAKSGELSPESIAKANRRRIAAEEGRQALAEVERKANAVRDNMARLRALREADEMRRRQAQPPAGSPKTGKSNVKPKLKQAKR
jgi:hypothetical protein